MARRPNPPCDGCTWIPETTTLRGHPVPGHWRPPAPSPHHVWVPPHVRDGQEIKGTWRARPSGTTERPRMRVAPPTPLRAPGSADDVPDTLDDATTALFLEERPPASVEPSASDPGEGRTRDVAEPISTAAFLADGQPKE